MQAISSKTKARSYARSSSFQMAVFFSILCGLAVITLGYMSHYFSKESYVEQIDNALNIEIKTFEVISSEQKLFHKALYGVHQQEGRIAVVFEDSKRPIWLPEMVSILKEGVFSFVHGQDRRVYAAKIHTFPDGMRLLVGYDMTELKKDYDFLQLISLLTIVFMLTVIGVSFLISTFVVRGTNKIAVTAREIMETGDLSRRISVGSRWDDLGNMVIVLNGMLERIEELMQGVRHVSDNIAHDLRTPLTRMKNKIAALEEHVASGTTEGIEDGLHIIAEEAEQLLGVFNALLRISRIEAEKQRKQFKDIQLDDVLSDAVAFYEPLAESKSVTINPKIGKAVFFGDTDLLFQAFINIIDNAIKFTPDDSQIGVSLKKHKKELIIEVQDCGPGLGPNEVDKVFQRFYRTDASRNTKGSGLGLSMVAAIIHLHGGSIEMNNQDAGLCVRISLPL